MARLGVSTDSRWSAIFSFCLAVLLSSPAGAEWQTFNTSDGLSANDVLCMTIDRDGDYWFGTSQGVSRYDGVRWRTFTTADGLASNRVNAVLEDCAGVLWFATGDPEGEGRGGLTRYDGTNWRTYDTDDGLASDDVWAILQDRTGNLWIGTRAGTSRFDGETWTTFDSPIREVVTIYEDRSGDLWFGAGGDGVIRYDGSNWTRYTEADGLVSNTVLAIRQDRSGRYWFGTWRGLSCFDGSSWTSHLYDYGPILAILEDKGGDIWVGTGNPYVGPDVGAGGAWRFDGHRWTSYQKADGLAADFVTSILEDRAGNLWFCTEGGGASRYDKVSWNTFLVPQHNRARARAVVEDLTGNIWVGLGLEEMDLEVGGARRYDGTTWTSFTTIDGLVSDNVRDILADRNGNLWFGTEMGLSRFDGATWRTYTTADGLPDDFIHAIAEGPSGHVWVGTNSGAVRFDGTQWSGLPDSPTNTSVTAILEDRSGNVWLGMQNHALSRYDGVRWTEYPEAALGTVTSILEDRDGDLWFASSWYTTAWHSGVSLFDGVSWNLYDESDGLASNPKCIYQDRSGALWFGTGSGAIRYDRENWRTYTTSDGLAHNWVTDILEDHSGKMWFATDNGVSVYQPDRVFPMTEFVNNPGEILATRQIGIAFVPAFAEPRVEFSYSLDEEPWSSWSTMNNYNRMDVADGLHRLRVNARDRDYNVEPSPAMWSFEVDATPPAPVLVSPSFGQPVRGSFEIRGTTADARFEVSRVEVRVAGSASWNPPETRLISESSAPVSDGVLAHWDTATLPDGDYDLRVAVSDSLGLVGSTQVRVILDNHAPYADVTSPAKVTAATGGDIYTTGSELHLYFPPRAFREDAIVTIEPTPADSVPQTLPSGVSRVVPGYEIAWSGAVLQKQATLEFSLAGVDSAASPGSLALYGLSDDATWRRFGGTVDQGADHISLAITEPGRYALFAESSVSMGERTLSSLSFTPRVFSATGGFADRQVGIGFSLGRPGPVTVRVYSRSGRLIREVLSGQSMNAGANLVRWDGLDLDGGLVTDGVYLVTVEALGRTATKTLAVVR